MKSNSRRITFFWISICFFLSGFAALLYETVWLRQFAILLGTTEQSLAIVLSSYMGGLAIGAVAAAKWAHRIRRPLLVYGILEFGIAIAALLIPFELSLVESLQSSLFGSYQELPSAGGFVQGAFTFGSVMALIAIPTSLMGATLPLLSSHTVDSDEHLGSRIGALYSINTFGAVAGTLVAAFFCLPNFGLSRTTWMGAAINIVVFALVAWIVSRDSSSDQSHEANPTVVSSEPTARRIDKNIEGWCPRNRWILALIFVSGAISFCYEIVFTRMMGHYLGGSVYSFSTMLAGFLLGIAAGGAIAARYSNKRHIALVGFVFAQCLTATFALVAFRSLDRSIEMLMSNGSIGSGGYVSVMMSIGILLPMATSIGATFPFAIRIFSHDYHDAGSSSGIVYSVNVVGGIIGSLLTGVFLMPWLQYHGTVVAAVIGNLGLAVAAVMFIGTQRLHLAWPAVAMCILALFFPRLPENVLRSTPLESSKIRGEMLFNHVGKSATVSVFYNEGFLSFVTNGLPEARLLPPQSGMDSRLDGGWLTALPPLLNPQCESMLVIGLGGGVAVQDVAPSVKSIDVIELEPAVVEANQRVATLRTKDPLSDPRVSIVLNDGRNALSRTQEKFDAIVSQPSHPWTAGASHLYTHEFAMAVRKRLNSRGIFLQWISSEFVDPELVASMAATLADVFPHVRMYCPFAGTFLFVASDQAIQPERTSESISEGKNTETDPGRHHSELSLMASVDRDYYRRRGVITRTHLLSMLMLDEAGIQSISAGAPIIRDEKNLLAMKAPKLLGNSRSDDVEHFVAKHSPAVRGREELLRLCPTFHATGFVKKIKRNSNFDSVKDDIVKLFESDADRAVHHHLLDSSSKQEIVENLIQLQSESPEDGRLAFNLLRYSLLGVLPEPIEQKKMVDLKSLLTKNQALAIECIELLVKNDLEQLRIKDEQLSNISVDVIEHETAVLCRLPWRLETPGAEGMDQALDMLAIIDNNSPFLHPAILSWYRVEAAVRANYPYAALSSANVLAKDTEVALLENHNQQNAGNLQRIYRTISDPRPFSAVPRWRYLEVLNLVADVLRQLNNG